MSKYTRRGRAELEAKTTRMDVVAYFDGHRVAYGDRHVRSATIRTFCKKAIEVPVVDLLTVEGRGRAAVPTVPCPECEAEIARLDRLLRSDPSAHDRELDRLFVEGRGEKS